MTIGSSLALAGLELLVQLVQRDARAGAARQRGFAQLALPVIHDVAGLGFVGHLEVVARLGHALQTEHFDRRGRPRLFHRAAVVVKQRAHFAVHRAADEDVAGVQRAVLHQHGGHRAAAPVHAGFQHGAAGGRLGIGAQFAQIGHQQDHLQQLVEILLLLGGDFDHDRVAAPLLGHQPAVGELPLDALGLRFRLVDLVDGHDDGHAGGSRVIDGFERLRHDAVVRRHHQHDDVGDLRAARAHARERFVARRIHEHDAASVDRKPRRRRCAG